MSFISAVIITYICYAACFVVFCSYIKNENQIVDKDIAYRIAAYILCVLFLLAASSAYFGQNKHSFELLDKSRVKSYHIERVVKNEENIAPPVQKPM